MTVHTIVGAGQVGTRLASLLVARGDDVHIVSRRGSGPEGAQAISADASDLSSLQAATEGSDLIYNCLNPRYHRWPVDWPPMASNLLECARGRVLVTLSNLYGYGPVSGPMTEQTRMAAHTVKGSVRIRMWEDAMAADRAGDLHAVEVRASDYIGEGGGQVMFGERAVPRIRAGKTVRIIGRPDQPHTWTYTGDVAATLAAVALDESAWGRAWHVPSNEPRTQEQVVGDLASALGARAPVLRSVPRSVLRLMGVVVPELREFDEMLYEFDRPFVMDSTAAQVELGLKPTPWDDVIEETLLKNPA